MFKLSLKVKDATDLACIGSLIQTVLCPLGSNNEPILYMRQYCESMDSLLRQSSDYLSAYFVLTDSDDIEHLERLSFRLNKLAQECDGIIDVIKRATQPPTTD